MTVKKKLVDSAIGLLRRRGVAGTGLAAVLEDSAVARRSIYLNFPDGKNQLVAEATRVAGERVHSRMLRHEGSAEELIALLIQNWIKELQQADFRAGCPVAAAAMGHEVAAEAGNAAGDAFEAWTEALASSYEADGLARREAQTSATLAVCAIEGAIILAQATRSIEPLQRVMEGLTGASGAGGVARSRG
ncbi:TetR/AcrR family transcriptional repressor of lmrAB and yxaGH operons [Arthrobacter woluwensis]|uniref:TetR/AcrR family transcriptional regulator n=1 Tax=Arthrobacter woluwensis TaxID=156980 RepID=UPI00278BA850|nr:TetR/AcrR family transcriptional regulator [Arthrobacter woluwensis]MDQ0708618.1 TetR/AcrR family transcriptional repressor of lmrAB and yxaGH operons [Arthrobacter woluwensis]